MKDNLEQIQALAKKISLDPAKKSLMRGDIIRFIEAHEAISAMPARVNSFAQRFLAPAGVFAFLLLIGGGTSLAAENALPGEPLYKVKLSVNEPMLAALHISADSKATWHTEVALRRLEEADSLAIQGKLTPEVKNDIAAKFEDSANKAAVSIAALNQKGSAESATDISNNFESSLKAHAEILTELDAPKQPVIDAPAAAALRTSAPQTALMLKQDTAKDENELVTKIHSVISTLAKERGEAEVKVAEDSGKDSKRSEKALTRITAAKAAIAVASKSIDDNTDTLGADATAAARTRLSVAQAIEASAEAKATSSPSDAFRLAGQSIRKAQEIRVLVAAQLKAGEHQGIASSAKASVNLIEPNNPQDNDGGNDIIHTADPKNMDTASTTVGAPVIQHKSDTSVPAFPILNVDGSKDTESP